MQSSSNVLDLLRNGLRRVVGGNPAQQQMVLLTSIQKWDVEGSGDVSISQLTQVLAPITRVNLTRQQQAQIAAMFPSTSPGRVNVNNLAKALIDQSGSANLGNIPQSVAPQTQTLSINTSQQSKGTFGAFSPTNRGSPKKVYETKVGGGIVTGNTAKYIPKMYDGRNTAVVGSGYSMSPKKTVLSPKYQSVPNQMRTIQMSPQRNSQYRKTQSDSVSASTAVNLSQGVIKQFRDVVTRRGGSHGIRTIGAIFRRMDDNGNRTLSREELKDGLSQYGLFMSKQEINVLFAALDTEGNGSISFNEFLRAIRGNMNAGRVRLVMKAYRIMDKNNDGFVTLADLRRSYDTRYHPDVLNGSKSADQIYTSFMQQWETDSVDGKVTQAEFIEYYQDVSASIDDDNYFELMMRNAWHISGGKGQSANTANLRVLVSFTSGEQRVVEVQNDLGIDRSDIRAIRSQLRRQGLSNIAQIRVHG